MLHSNWLRLRRLRQRQCRGGLIVALHYLAKALHRVTSTSFGYRVTNRTRLGDGIFEKYSCINTNWFEFQIQNYNILKACPKL